MKTLNKIKVGARIKRIVHLGKETGQIDKGQTKFETIKDLLRRAGVKENRRVKHESG